MNISDIRAKRAADRAKTGDIWPTRLVEQNTVDGIGTQVVLDLFEQPGAKRLMIETGDIMIAPMAIHHAAFRMVKSVPARYDQGTGK